MNKFYHLSSFDISG